MTAHIPPPSPMMEAIGYPSLSSQLSFSDYIAACHSMITTRRVDLTAHTDAARILEANAPYELHPITSSSNEKIPYGALLLHGLLDCPFSLKDIGSYLQSQGILCRSLLLPGHGTVPQDLLEVSYHDWLYAVQYGIQALQQKVEHLFLIGYSTGAALSIYQALTQTPLAGMVLLSPAIRISTPIMLAASSRALIQKLCKQPAPWLIKNDEVDYAKYKSIPLNAVLQVSALTAAIQQLQTQTALTMPMLLFMSQQDETVSSQSAMHFFSKQQHPESRMYLYTTALTQSIKDKRIIIRPSAYPHLHIRTFSHTAIPFSPTNSHYGQQGDYPFAAYPDTMHYLYGPYNPLETFFSDKCYQWKLAKRSHRELTYNPDFYFMAKEIGHFIKKT